MNEETQSTEGSEEQAAPASDGRAITSGSRSESIRSALEAGPSEKPDARGPGPGLMHVLDPQTGMWMVRRDPAYKGEGESTQEQPTEAKQDDADVNDAYKRGGEALVLPDHLPSSVLNDPDAPVLLGEVKEILGAANVGAPQAQRLVDVFSEFYLEDRNANVPVMMPPGPDGRAANEDAFRAILQQRWGKDFSTRLGLAQKTAQKLGPAFIGWLNKTGAGNSPAVLETLAAWGEGTMAMKPAEAKAKLAEMRADAKGPLRNAGHPGHRAAVAKARVLSLHVANVEDGKGGLDRKVATMQDAERTKENTQSDATQKLDEEILRIRMDKGYMDASAANHKILVARMQELMRQRWPD